MASLLPWGLPARSRFGEGRGERVRPPARKSLWLGEVRGNLSYHHPHLNPPPSSPEPNMVQGKGEESSLENWMPRSSLRARGPPSGAEAPLGRSLGRRRLRGTSLYKWRKERDEKPTIFCDGHTLGHCDFIRRGRTFFLKGSTPSIYNGQWVEGDPGGE